MKVIGITGGIGSGKSTVCAILEKLGYPVFYSDEVAKINMLENLDLINAITQSFGKESYIDKKLNRDFLAKQVFSKAGMKEKLNALVHPTVYQSFEKWKSEQSSAFVFNESALLYETGSFARFDEIWLVIADLETRINRVIKRDNCTREEVLSRVKNQLSDTDKIKFAPKIIDNSQGKMILEQVLVLLK